MNSTIIVSPTKTKQLCLYHGEVTEQNTVIGPPSLLQPCSACFHHVFTIYSPCVHRVCIHRECIHHVFTVYSSCIHYVFTMYSPCIHHVFIMYSPCIHCVFNHHVFTMYSSCIHPVFNMIHCCRFLTRSVLLCRSTFQMWKRWNGLIR